MPYIVSMKGEKYVLETERDPAQVPLNSLYADLQERKGNMYLRILRKGSRTSQRVRECKIEMSWIDSATLDLYATSRSGERDYDISSCAGKSSMAKSFGKITVYETERQKAHNACAAQVQSQLEARGISLPLTAARRIITLLVSDSGGNLNTRKFDWF